MSTPVLLGYFHYSLLLHDAGLCRLEHCLVHHVQATTPDHVGPLFTDCWRISRGSDGPWPRVHVGVLFGANGIRLRSVLLEVSATPSNHPGERVGPPLVTLRQSMHRMNRAFHTCHDITGCMKNPSSFSDGFGRGGRTHHQVADVSSLVNPWGFVLPGGL